MPTVFSEKWTKTAEKRSKGRIFGFPALQLLEELSKYGPCPEIPVIEHKHQSPITNPKTPPITEYGTGTGTGTGAD
jgi:hypothetical protein